MAKYAVVLYHANCMDGMGSAWAFSHLVEQSFYRVEYIPVKYGQIPGKDFQLGTYPADAELEIFILDFSFPRNILTELSRFANRVLLLDHHKSAQADLTDWTDKPENLEIVFDMTRSGAGITWDHFTTLPRPYLIEYIEDRDLWKFKQFRSKEINAYIAAGDLTLQEYQNTHQILLNSFYHCADIGSMLLKAHEKNVRSCIESSKRRIFVDGTEGLVCNCSPMFASDVGNHLAFESGTFGATYYQASDGKFHFSLRANDNVDVSLLAKKFGGGGHKNAAGFVVQDFVDNTESIAVNPV